MRLISIPANPEPDEAATAMLQTPDEVLLRYARWAPPPGRKGTVCIFQGRAEFIEKYFEVVRDLRARLCGRDLRLARARALAARAQGSAQGTRRQLRRI